MVKTAGMLLNRHLTQPVPEILVSSIDTGRLSLHIKINYIRLYTNIKTVGQYIPQSNNVKTAKATKCSTYN